MKINFNRRKQTQPERDQAMRVPYPPAKRNVAQLRWYLILLVVGSPLIYFALRMLYLLLIVNAPGFISLEKIIVNSSINGLVETVMVKPGDIVEQGAPLVELRDPLLDEREKNLRSEIDALQSPLPPSGSDLDALLADRIRLAEEMVRYQEEQLAKVRSLFALGAATRAELNTAEERHNGARFTYNQAQSQLSERLEQLREATVGPLAKNSLQSKQLESELDAIGQQRENMILTSSARARVLDVYIKNGEVVAPGTTLMLLGELERVSITAYLPPKYARYSRAGQTATATLPNGSRVQAAVRYDAGLTKRLPADLASAIGNRDLMIIVQLAPTETIPSPLMIDGLPVSLRFHGLGGLIGRQVTP